MQNNIFRHCPVCKSRFKNRKVSDILMSGLVCEREHRFSVVSDWVLIKDSTGKFLKLHYNSSSEVEVMNAWLTNPEYRKHLSDPLADLLRMFLDIKFGEYNYNKTKVPQVKQTFEYCPICGESLGYFEQGDIWIVGRRCKNAHTWSERGRCLWAFEEKGKPKNPTLCMDMDYDFFVSSVKGYLYDKKVSKYVPSQVKELLLYIKNDLAIPDATEADLRSYEDDLDKLKARLRKIFFFWQK